MSVGDRGPAGSGRVVVHVEDVDRRAGQELQPLDARASLVQVVDVGQDAGPRVARLDGDERCLAEPAQRFGMAPDLNLGHDAELLAEFEQGAVALGDSVEVDVGAVGDAYRRRGEAEAADLADHLHVPPRLLEGLLAAGVVIDGPLEEADGALDAQAEVVDPLAQVGERAAVGDVAVELADPGLDAVVAGLGCDRHLLGKRKLLSLEGAGVEAVAERLVGRPIGRGVRHRGDRADRRAGAQECGYGGQPLASRQIGRHLRALSTSVATKPIVARW